MTVHSFRPPRRGLPRPRPHRRPPRRRRTARVPGRARSGHHGHHGHHGHKGKVVWDSTSLLRRRRRRGRPRAGPRREDEGEAAGQAARRLAHLRQAPGAPGRASSPSPAALNWYGTHKVRVSTSGRHALQPQHHGQRAAAPTSPRGNPADHVFLNDRGDPLLLRPVQDGPLRRQRRRRRPERQSCSRSSAWPRSPRPPGSTSSTSAPRTRSRSRPTTPGCPAARTC